MFELDDFHAPEPQSVWQTLTQVLGGFSPSSGCDLPGAVGDTISNLAAQLVPEGTIVRNLRYTGNIALQLGPPSEHPDLVIVAHMDRPSYRVRAIAENGTGELFPICAIRLPAGAYRTGARAFRFEGGELVAGATGSFVAEPKPSPESGHSLYFEASEGHLTYWDTVVLDTPPTLDEASGQIISTGLDNALGVTVSLLTAGAVAQIAQDLGRSCWFVFTDHEEGPPDGYFFSQGADRLTRAVAPPRIGVINVDAHNAGDNLPVKVAQGASYSITGGDGKGSVVPPNYASLLRYLGEHLNNAELARVQHNNGYLSRSDDMPLHRWSRLLALIGPPLMHAHTGYETANLNDVVDAISLLTHVVALALGASQAATKGYHLSF